ncbi:Putative ATPase [Mycobacterium tuberculosis]|nr:Putative ATPase [Mycobacterium tuberculosis]
MITRVEIDGFKSFLDFTLDVPPFLALVGPNASGKSNLFDAIDFIQDSRSRPPYEALLGARRGRPKELFHRVSEGRSVDVFTVVARCLLKLTDGLAGAQFSESVALAGGVPEPGQSHSAILGLQNPADLPGPVRERESQLADTDDDEAFWHVADLLEQEMLRLGHYVPDPQAMRAVGSLVDRRPLLSNGGNIAAVLGRMSASEALGDLMVDLAALVPDVREVRTELDEKRQEWSFDLVLEGQGCVPSTLLSDGTLRILGLLAALHDPDHSGVLLVEEIENGLHPGRLAELLRRIQERVTDLNDPESLDRPLRQVIITSHSPVVVSELYRTRPESLVFMDTAVRVDPEKERVSRVIVAKPVRDEGEPGTFVSPRQVRKYLGTVRQDEL